MKKLFFVYATVLSFSMQAQTKYEYLDINNIAAGFNSDGTLFMINKVDTVVVNGVTRTFSRNFNVPKASTTNSIFASNLWIAGIDDGGILHTAANTYKQSGTDFWAGPIANEYNSQHPDMLPGNAYDSTYNFVWKVSKAEIQKHISDYNKPNYEMPWAIANWPANGNFLNGTAIKLAPFKDLNNNSRYEPELGEYPVILGDQAVFFIFNDDRGIHGQTGGNKLKIEVHAMAYAFNDTKPELNNTIFINYKLYNRSEINFPELRIGLWTDFDLGCPFNDMIGCDTLLNSYFSYNGQPFDLCAINGYGNYPPAQAVTFLNAEMSSFNDATFGILVLNNSERYYRLLSGYKSDGTPYLRPANSCNVDSLSVPTKYLFFDDPNNTNANAYSEINCGIPDGDRRALGSIKELSLPAKSSLCLDIAFPFAQDSNGTNLTSVTLLKERVVAIQNYYNNNQETLGCNAISLATSAVDVAPEYPLLNVFPNPAQEELFVTINKYHLKESMELFIYDVSGKVVFGKQLNENNLKVDISAWQSGLYFISTHVNGKVYSKRFVKF